MTIPTLLFGLLLSLFYGAAFHLIRGGGSSRLVLYLGLSLVGFAVGHGIGVWRGWGFFPLGSLKLGMATAGSLLFLLLGDWLSRIETE